MADCASQSALNAHSTLPWLKPDLPELLRPAGRYWRKHHQWRWWGLAFLRSSGWPPAGDRVVDEPPELGRGAEVGGKPVLGDGKRDPGRGVAAREAATGATDAEHGVGVLRRRTETSDRVPQPPGRRVAEDLVRTARGDGGRFAEPLRRDEADAIDFGQQRGIHATDGPG